MIEPDYESFVREASPALFRFACAISKNEHDAWDLLQDGLVRVGLRWGRMSTSSSPMAYCKSVLVNLNVDRFRRLRREVLMSEPPELPGPARTDPELDSMWIADAWLGLSPHQRTAVGLHYLEDAPITAIADLLQCREATVRSHLSRGLSRLRGAQPQSRILDEQRD